MIKKVFSCVLVCVLLTSIISVALANEVMPRADLYFDSASAFLASNKLVVFNCVTYDIYNRIEVTNVWLERQVNGSWQYVKALTPPSYVAINMMDYGAEVDYSAEITGSGTFRIGFTVNADGYSITRYSNSRTF